jgi:hypothetical protein
MFHSSAIQNRICGNITWKKYGLIYLSSLILTSCAHIEVQPKDEQLVKLENFARVVTKHIYDNDPSSYLSNQNSLKSEVTPPVHSELASKSLCAKTPAEAQAKLKALKQSGSESGFKIESADFSGKTTEQGLVPVEVKGVTGSLTKPEKFDIVLFIGFKPKSNTPVIGEINIK